MKMLRITLVFGLGMVLLPACQAQEDKAEEQENEKVIQRQKEKKRSDTQDPDVRIEVEKQYNEEGDLIRYDSLYTYSYWSSSGDSMTVNVDSLFQDFRAYFHEHYAGGPDMTRDPFQKEFLRPDSLRQSDFLDDEYFFHRFEQEQRRMDRLFREMDSLKRDFLDEEYPGVR